MHADNVIAQTKKTNFITTLTANRQKSFARLLHCKVAGPHKKAWSSCENIGLIKRPFKLVIGSNSLAANCILLEWDYAAEFYATKRMLCACFPELVWVNLFLCIMCVYMLGSLLSSTRSHYRDVCIT